jgi:phage recombination protein Bet
MTEKSLTIVKKNEVAHPFMEKLQLIKETICVGITDNEFEMFMYHCNKLGLDPLARQIYPVKRRNNALGRDVMSIQTGIDGYRLIADRTGKYSPGKDPEYVYDKDGRLVCAKSYVKKQTRDGKWHEISASAHYCEYASLNKSGQPMMMWASMPRVMLSKCAEAMALRKAFPAELSGVYTKEEMDQADNPTIDLEKNQEITEEKPEEPKEKCTVEQAEAFISSWSATHEEEILRRYIEKKSEYLKEDPLETVFLLIEDEVAFEKQFITWKGQNGNGKIKELVQAPSVNTG